MARNVLCAWRQYLSVATALALLTACEEFSQAVPVAAPAPLAPNSSLRPQPIERSQASYDLARYYMARQNDLLTQDLLRRDGGGPDTPYSADDLSVNFEAIVFYDESSNLNGAQSRPGHLRRWEVPVRIGVEFGASVPAAQRREDSQEVSRFANRLSRITGHPISRPPGNTNFHVLFMGLDDKAQLTETLMRLAPSLRPDTLAFVSAMPRTIECSVLAFADGDAPFAYTRAIAIIRSELPDLLRLSCIHEELAQGLGPANDSPAARPSIFNDDDEFALLTSHDEALLKMLYDPRLKTGMTADQARGVTRIIARELMGQTL